MSSSTLEWFIEQGDAFNWSTQPFAATISGMIETGLQEWGFVIYRCVYGDDEEWKRFMKYFEDDVINGLEKFGGDVVVSLLPVILVTAPGATGRKANLSQSYRNMPNGQSSRTKRPLMVLLLILFAENLWNGATHKTYNARRTG